MQGRNYKEYNRQYITVTGLILQKMRKLDIFFCTLNIRYDIRPTSTYVHVRVSAQYLKKKEIYVHVYILHFDKALRITCFSMQS